MFSIYCSPFPTFLLFFISLFIYFLIIHFGCWISCKRALPRWRRFLLYQPNLSTINKCKSSFCDLGTKLQWSSYRSENSWLMYRNDSFCSSHSNSFRSITEKYLNWDTSRVFLMHIWAFFKTITLLFGVSFHAVHSPHMLHCGFNSKNIRVSVSQIFRLLLMQVTHWITLNASCRRRVYFHLLPRDGDPWLELEWEKRGGGDKWGRQQRGHLSHECATAGIQLRGRLHSIGYTGRAWQGAEHPNPGHKQMKCLLVPASAQAKEYMNQDGPHESPSLFARPWRIENLSCYSNEPNLWLWIGLSLFV